MSEADKRHYPAPTGLDPLAPSLTEALADPLHIGFAVAHTWKLTDREAAAAFGYLSDVARFWRERLPVGIDADTVARGVYLVGIHRAAQWWCGGDIESFVRRALRFPQYPGKRIVDLVASGDVRRMAYVYRYLRTDQS